jgi:hypothetical protein
VTMVSRIQGMSVYMLRQRITFTSLFVVLLYVVCTI